jgi:hypothetical protein
VSLARSLTDRWERRVLIRAPAADRWMSWVPAQNRITVPARAGPSQNCRPATHMFPDGGTTRSNSMGPPSQLPGAGAGCSGGAVVLAGPGTRAGATAKPMVARRYASSVTAVAHSARVRLARPTEPHIVLPVKITVRALPAVASPRRSAQAPPLEQRSSPERSSAPIRLDGALCGRTLLELFVISFNLLLANRGPRRFAMASPTLDPAPAHADPAPAKKTEQIRHWVE